MVWLTARGPVRLDRPQIVGVVNVTPDSFWHGGRHPDPREAVELVAQMLDEGVDLIDLGGESTRPGTERVEPETERARVIPVLEAIVERWPDLIVSVDTVRAETARAALDAGAAAINDVSGLRLDPELGPLIAERRAGAILMHSRGTVEEMARYDLATYGDDPVGEIIGELEETLEEAQRVGIGDEAIVLDPGLGFSKRTEHSVATLAQLERFEELGYPILIGPSRKRFVGEVAGGLPVEERLEGTIAAIVIGYLRGARLFRVHDISAARRALALAEAVVDLS